MWQIVDDIRRVDTVPLHGAPQPPCRDRRRHARGLCYGRARESALAGVHRADRTAARGCARARLARLLRQ